MQCFETTVAKKSVYRTELEYSMGKNGMILISPHLGFDFFEIGYSLFEWRMRG